MTPTRVTVVLNRPELEPEGEPRYLAEWGHETNYSTDEDGCHLDWGDGYSSYFPWPSVLRVDWEPCECVTCQRTAERAA